MIPGSIGNLVGLRVYSSLLGPTDFPTNEGLKMNNADAIVADIFRSFSATLTGRISESVSSAPFMKPGVSPIERVLGTALEVFWVGTYNLLAMEKGCPKIAEFFYSPGVMLEELMENTPPYALAFWHQVKIGPYEADFVAYFKRKNRDPVWVGIKCDGHDFHDRTKEQAIHDRKRDRYFQTRGLSIFRFTGSEIWNDPMGVCDQLRTFVQPDAA